MGSIYTSTSKTGGLPWRIDIPNAEGIKTPHTGQATSLARCQSTYFIIVTIDETFLSRGVREPNADFRIHWKLLSNRARLENPAYCFIWINVGAGFVVSSAERSCTCPILATAGVAPTIGERFASLSASKPALSAVEGTGGPSSL
ncbi:MAG: hypothetical protein ACREOW_18665 [Thermodesulfobacteriota bacterium]